MIVTVRRLRVDHWFGRVRLRHALAATAAAGVGLLATAQAMFVDADDPEVLWVVMALASLVGVCTALVLGRQVVDASRAVAEATRSLGDGAVVHDEGHAGIAELAGMSRQLRDTSEQLYQVRVAGQAADGVRKDLVTSLSRDLRTPLSAIRAIAEALEDGVVTDPDTVAGYYAALRRETDRMAGLVDGLLAKAQPDLRGSGVAGGGKG